MAEVPEGARLAVIREYAAEVVGCTPDRVTTVSRFEDGNRHDVYKVTYNADGAAEHLVVRVSLSDDPAERAQADREGRVLEKVGGVAAPRLRDFRLTSAWFATPVLSMGFVPGWQLELSSATSAEIEQLGSVVARVHGLRVDDLAESLSETGTIASYAEGRLQSILSTLAWVREPLPSPLQGRLRDAAGSLRIAWEARRDAESFRTGESLALLHGDIAPGNILWGPDPVLIDWEYSRLGDPSDEVGYLFDQNGLDAPQREAFWRGYQARISSEMRLTHVIERVNWWEPLTLLGSTLWWVERWVRRTEAVAAGTVDPAVPREAGYYFDQVVRRLDRLEPLPDRA